PLEPFTQVLRPGRGYEDRYGVGDALAHLPGPLDLDLQHDPDSLLEAWLDLRHERPVEVAGIGRVLHEFVCRQATLEFLRGKEVVVDGVALAGTWRSRGGGDRQFEAGQSPKQPLDQRSLSD